MKEEWQPMATAPKGGYPIQHIRAITKDGTIHEDVHWASDLSGEDQPPFEGWFVPQGKHGFYQIEDPVGWMKKL